MEALEHDLFYVGALGSERTSTARRQRLLQLDLNEPQLDKLHAPIGLPIGSKTPMEISIAILGQLTQLRSARVKAGA
jgi:xanthine dehydrogenase accessory factor